MEVDARHRNQRNKRRERAQRMLEERRQRIDGDRRTRGLPRLGGGAVTRIEDSDAEDVPVTRSARPPRPQPKKKREPLFEEDLIDGFSIVSFKSNTDMTVNTHVSHLLIFRGKQFSSLS
jgi:hypothetical protein